MINKDWLKELKKGDKVIVQGSYSSKSIGVVERLTKTQIVLENGSKFNINDGFSIPRQKWYISFLMPFEQNLYEEIILKNTRKNLSIVDWDKQDEKTVFKVWNLINGKKEG